MATWWATRATTERWAGCAIIYGGDGCQRSALRAVRDFGIAAIATGYRFDASMATLMKQ